MRHLHSKMPYRCWIASACFLYLWGACSVFAQTTPSSSRRIEKLPLGEIAVSKISKDVFGDCKEAVLMLEHLQEFAITKDWHANYQIVAQMTLANAVYSKGGVTKESAQLVKYFIERGVPQENLEPIVARHEIHLWLKSQQSTKVDAQQKIQLAAFASRLWGVSASSDVETSEELNKRIISAQQMVLQTLVLSGREAADRQTQTFVGQGLPRDRFGANEVRLAVLQSIRTEVAAQSEPVARRNIVDRAIGLYGFKKDELEETNSEVRRDVLDQIDRFLNEGDHGKKLALRQNLEAKWLNESEAIQLMNRIDALPDNKKAEAIWILSNCGDALSAEYLWRLAESNLKQPDISVAALKVLESRREIDGKAIARLFASNADSRIVEALFALLKSSYDEGSAKARQALVETLENHTELSIAVFKAIANRPDEVFAHAISNAYQQKKDVELRAIALQNLLRLPLNDDRLSKALHGLEGETDQRILSAAVDAIPLAISLDAQSARRNAEARAALSSIRNRINDSSIALRIDRRFAENNLQQERVSQPVSNNIVDEMESKLGKAEQLLNKPSFSNENLDQIKRILNDCQAILGDMDQNKIGSEKIVKLKERAAAIRSRYLKIIQAPSTAPKERLEK